MTRDPDQLHLVEVPQAFAGKGNQDHQPGYPRTVRSPRIAQRNVAVAAQQQLAGASLPGHFKRSAKRMQFSFVVAAGACRPATECSVRSAVRRDEDDAEAHLARIGQTPSRRTRPATAFGGRVRPGWNQNRLATTKRSRAASFSRPLTTSSEAPHFMMWARKVVIPCDSA
jgi:hypothetical protein